MTYYDEAEYAVLDECMSKATSMLSELMKLTASCVALIGEITALKCKAFLVKGVSSKDEDELDD